MRNAWPHIRGHWCARRPPAGYAAQGEKRADEAKFAGTGDMDDVRFELPHRASDQGQMAKESEIDAQVLLERKGKEAALQLKAGDPGAADIRLGTVSGPHRKKRQIATLSKRLELTAGVGNPVYLMERVGKIGDAHKLSLDGLIRAHL